MADNVVHRRSNIILNVGLNAEGVPVDMTWFAEDNTESPEPQPCKAILVSIFDKEHLDTLKIDLWTTDLQLQEMDRLLYHTLKGLADTYIKATNNKNLAEDMRRFAQYFGEQTEILVKTEP